MTPADIPAANSMVTWTELLSVASLAFLILSAVLGVFWNMIKNLSLAIGSLRDVIDNHRVEVAKTYVTTEALVRVEERLSDSLNQMSHNIGESLHHLTDRIEKVISDMVDFAKD